MTDISDVRKRAWETRRKKYGERGHNSNYIRYSVPVNYQGMLDMIIRLHVEEVLSEGQVAKATGLPRVEIRKLADNYTNSLP